MSSTEAVQSSPGAPAVGAGSAVGEGGVNGAMFAIGLTSDLSIFDGVPLPYADRGPFQLDALKQGRADHGRPSPSEVAVYFYNPGVKAAA
jgi:hypothetical protein